MKRIAYTAIAAAALVAGPALAQQAPATAPAPGETFLSLWDLDEDGQVTLEELQSRRSDIFAGFDADEDGMLSGEEFDALDAARADSMQRPAGRGQGAGNGARALGRQAIDTDADGAVSAEEYTAAATAFMAVMDGNQDGVLTQEDFGPGARQAGMGNGQGRDMARAQQPGAMGGKARPGGGMGRSDARGQTQAGRCDPSGQQAMRGQGKGGQGQGGQRQGGQRQGQGHGHGGQQMGRGQQGTQATFSAFPTDDGGLWIVDARSGDILYCRASVDGDAPAGFTPVCKEVRM